MIALPTIRADVRPTHFYHACQLLDLDSRAAWRDPASALPHVVSAPLSSLQHVVSSVMPAGHAFDLTGDLVHGDEDAARLVAGLVWVALHRRLSRKSRSLS